MTNIAIGSQSFEKIRITQSFYVDKTDFIREWWEQNDDVTLITRPRRFGKTLNMSMMECFFSVKYAGRGALFEGLSIWEKEQYRALQGAYPVIFLSFAGVKANQFRGARNGKIAMEDLLAGGNIRTIVSEEVVFDQPAENSAAIWSLLLASGYLKVEKILYANDEEDTEYQLSLTNLEVRKEFGRMVRKRYRAPCGRLKRRTTTRR